MKQTLKSTILKFLDIFNDLMHHFQPIQQIFFYQLSTYERFEKSQGKFPENFVPDPESLLLIKNSMKKIAKAIWRITKVLLKAHTSADI